MSRIGNPTTRLSLEQQEQYRSRGYHYPIRVFDELEAENPRGAFLSYYERNKERMKDLIPRERSVYLMETHFFLRWVYDIVSHPRVLDAVESVLGPNILVWGSHWFPKLPGDKAFVSWHQDATYWGLTPPNVTTAWVALSASVPENGCMKVVSGSHKSPLLPQRDTYAPDNMLSRGQEIEVEVDESQVVPLILQPGEMSLHDIAIVHGSGANTSNKARIGLAIRYVSADVATSGPERELVLLVRGRNEHGHFEDVAPPDYDAAYGENPVHAEALRRKRRNLKPSDSGGAS
jgi:ectoine hydroxylase-related dioxygenase (phytanoyl-CoA dioxygenase family)